MPQLKHDWTEVVINVQHEMERLLGDYTSRKPPSVSFSPRAWAPAVDVYETAEEVVVLVELAGVTQDEIEVEVHGNVLIVKGERRDIKRGIRRSYSQMEILWGLFERSVVLPASVVTEETRAFYQDGFLEIVLPKAGRGTGHRIRVKGS